MQPGTQTWQAQDFADLRNILMRDFLALLPSLNPFVSKADPAKRRPQRHKTAGEA
jgi:hypothetical protein